MVHTKPNIELFLNFVCLIIRLDNAYFYGVLFGIEIYKESFNDWEIFDSYENF